MSESWHGLKIFIANTILSTIKCPKTLFWIIQHERSIWICNREFIFQFLSLLDILYY